MTLNRKHLISDIQIDMIRTELNHIMQNAIYTPDTNASYKSISGLLDSVQGS